MNKFMKVVLAQFNKLANFFWTRDPIAQMQLEYDDAVQKIKEGREGLEQYRGMVERVSRQVALGEKRQQELEARIKACLKAGDRQAAAQLAVQLQGTRDDLAENKEQLQVHETAYSNNVEKIKHASREMAKVREKIKKYEADLKMSNAEAEIAKLGKAFDFDVTTDFGELETVIQEKIDTNRGAVRVAADLSGQGLEEIRTQKAVEDAMAEDLLEKFEAEMGIKTPETAKISEEKQALGPEVQAAETVKQNK